MGIFDEIWMPPGTESRSISAENPDGRRGGGGRAEPDKENSPARNLGRGWKVRPCVAIPPKETFTIANIDGPGAIRHIWLTLDQKFYSACVLRMYWDDEDWPYVKT